MNRPLSLLFLSAMLVAALTSMVNAGDEAAEPVLGATLFQNTCAACHGPKGQGNEQLRIPSIAARPAWYVLTQLGNFQAGRRGVNVSEPQAMLMAALVKSLTPEAVESVAKHVEELPLVRPPAASVLKNPNLAIGRELFEERCMECHRYNGSGELAFGSPPVTGLQDWYMLAQIEKFKNGQRGAVPGDSNGAKMVLSSQFIEDEQAKHSVIAYILTLNPAGQSAVPHEAAERLFGAAAKPQQPRKGTP